MLRRLVLLAGVLVLFAVPAGAAPAPQVTDDCGDAGSSASFNEESADLEENRGHLDIKSAGVSSPKGADGFTAAVSVCGAVSSTQGTYLVQWGYGDQCYGTVAWSLASSNMQGGEGLEGKIQTGDAVEATVSEECYREATGPTAPVIGGNEVETVYRVTLPAEAVSFNGDTVTFNVASSLLPAAALNRLAPGTTWENITAVSMEQGAATWAGYFDTEGNRGQLTVRTDFAFGDVDYTVGEDAAS